MSAGCLYFARCWITYNRDSDTICIRYNKGNKKFRWALHFKVIWYQRMKGYCISEQYHLNNLERTCLNDFSKQILYRFPRWRCNFNCAVDDVLKLIIFSLKSRHVWLKSIDAVEYSKMYVFWSWQLYEKHYNLHYLCCSTMFTIIHCI